MKNFILDTNIFARLIIKDVPSQSEISQQLFREIEKDKIKGWVSILVIDELIWVLENYYHIERSLYLPQILNLLALKNIVIIEVKKTVIIKILTKMETTNLDFTDLYLVETAGAKKIVSFDKDLQKIAK